MEEVRVVEEIDVSKFFSGSWFEVARLPNEWEDTSEYNCMDVMTRYQIQFDGDRVVHVRVQNTCHLKPPPMAFSAIGKIDFGPRSKIRQEGDMVYSSPAIFSAQFFKDQNESENYWILEMDEDYRWALVGDPKKKDSRLWIIARDKYPSVSAVRYMIEHARERGFEVSKMMVGLMDEEKKRLYSDLFMS